MELIGSTARHPLISALSGACLSYSKCHFITAYGIGIAHESQIRKTRLGQKLPKKAMVL